jgi:hypothetical protein
MVEEISNTIKQMAVTMESQAEMIKEMKLIQTKLEDKVKSQADEIDNL